MKETGPKPFVFVLMPFDTSFNDIYHLGIKETCDKAGAYAERVDEQIYDGTITQRIYNQISKADFIVADMTDRNPNVFYETGYAHALNKRVILLTQNADHIPFDLKEWPHIIYGNSIQRLRDDLLKWLRWAIENPINDIHLLSPSIEFYINRIPICDNPSLKYFREETGLSLNLDIDAHNSTKQSIHPIRFRICLLSSPRFFQAYRDFKSPYYSAHLPDGNRVHIVGNTYEILPGGWESIKVQIQIHDSPLEVGSEHQFALKLLTEGQPVDFPFRVIVVKSEPKREYVYQIQDIKSLEKLP